MYLNGHGVEQNFETAIKWFEKSSKQGNKDAQNYLGLMYYDGIGVRQNYIISAEWFEKAADQGHPSAMFMLGKMYRDGEGVDFNEKSAELLQKSCKAGLKDACK